MSSCVIQQQPPARTAVSVFSLMGVVLPWKLPKPNAQQGGRAGLAAGPAGGHHREAVRHERRQRGGVELRGRPRAGGEAAQSPRAALPEGALERPLPALRGVAAPAGGTGGGQRAGAAARHTGDADGGAQVHQRLGGLGAEAPAGALEHAPHVHVGGQDGLAEGEAPDRRRRVRADARQRGEVLGPARIGDQAGRAVERQGAPVVAEALPLADHLRRARRGERVEVRPARHPRLEARHHAAHLGLLEHHLRHQHRVGVAAPAPGQIASGLGVPAQQRLLHRAAP